jgi:hypothetical protein
MLDVTALASLFAHRLVALVWKDKTLVGTLLLATSLGSIRIDG